MNVNRREILQLLALSGLGLSTIRPKIAFAENELDVIIPPRLKPGDVIGLVSPAGITRSKDKLNIIEETLAALDLKLHVDEHAMDRWGYLAGKDEVRAEAINKMYKDPEVDAILTFIGGWGCARLLPYLDYGMIQKHPKIIMGFSDVTALLLAIYAKTGMVTFHGPSGRSGWNTFTVDYVKRLLFDGEVITYKNPDDRGDNLTQVEDRIQTITPGKTQGRLVGGNLTVLTALIGSEYLPDWKGHILFVEDIGEGIYRIDRMMTQLKLAGVLDQLAGFVFGRCTDCDADSGYSSFTLQEVLEDHIKPLGIPAFRGSMIGHIKNKFTIPLGIEAEIDADRGTIQLLESAVG
ncbi:MAG: LD-carboxypeptidase [FCB group bacterium]|nr:LD-carboxypeptidase [FCB group bacterium]MBL7029211.1 LD-carboxypeptidase [Candidatus Neomarinimicrobiota bacterium]MBL7121125.1 LD-carboxypeptidase [Candidatus Neomarinimicrobiota bacterium]